MAERLEELVRAAQQHIQQTEECQLALAQLVDEILRSRKLGRSPKGQPLSGVYQAICDRVRQQLLNEVDQVIRGFDPKHISVREWASVLQKQAFSKILDDAQLKQLALEAQKHSPQTELRQHALAQLIEAIRLSGRLARPHRGKFAPQFYDLLYEEAVNRTLTYVCRNIDKYDPERGQNKKFMNWVNFRLDRMLIECRREFSDREVQELPDLDALEAIAQPQDSESLTDLIRECIELDAEKIFAQTHIRNRSEANFRAIALARFAQKSWEEISTEFDIKIPTLSSFFQRCCDKFIAKFQEYL